jgi:hypothetical protein
VAVVAVLLRAGAPGSPPAPDALLRAAQALGASGAAVVAATALAVAITLQPLQFRLVQLLEGYWSLRGTAWLFRLGVNRQRRRLLRAVDALPVTAAAGASPGRRRQLEERSQRAEAALRERFPAEDRLLPTALGNVCGRPRTGPACATAPTASSSGQGCSRSCPTLTPRR